MLHPFGPKTSGLLPVYWSPFPTEITVPRLRIIEWASSLEMIYESGSPDSLYTISLLRILTTLPFCQRPSTKTHTGPTKSRQVNDDDMARRPRGDRPVRIFFIFKLITHGVQKVQISSDQSPNDSFRRLQTFTGVIQIICTLMIKLKK